MGGNFQENGILNCSPLEGYNVASIKNDGININNNLLKNTYFTSNPSAYCIVDNTRLFQGLPTIKINQIGNTSNVYRGYSQSLPGLLPNETITASVWIYREKDSTFDGSYEMRVYQSHNDGSATNWAGFAPSLANWPTDKWIKVQRTYILDSNLSSAVFNLNVVKNGTYWIAAPKVEYGNIATPWCPAPSDYFFPQLEVLTNPIETNNIYEI